MTVTEIKLYNAHMAIRMMLYRFFTDPQNEDLYKVLEEYSKFSPSGTLPKYQLENYSEEDWKSFDSIAHIRLAQTFKLLEAVRGEWRHLSPAKKKELMDDPEF